MTSKVIIIPYFGKFNNYFDLFISSVSFNQTTDWLLFTDNEINMDLPKNVAVIQMSFQDFKEEIQKKFDFKIGLNRPYKIADFRPAFGYILHDYIQNYDFWGYGDTDVVVGDIDKFITQDILEDYDKIGFLGHFTLMRNTKKVNEAFMLQAGAHCEPAYKRILSSTKNMSFDELFDDSINTIFIRNGFRTLYKEFEFNTYMKTSNFYRTYYDFKSNLFEVDKKKGFLSFDNGKLAFVVQNSDKSVVSKEYMYVHFQSRKMKVDTQNKVKFKIIPNTFEDLSVNYLDASNFEFERLKHINLHYFRLRFNNLRMKIKKRLFVDE